jgi:hypothetical protein
MVLLKLRGSRTCGTATSVFAVEYRLQPGGMASAPHGRMQEPGASRDLIVWQLSVRVRDRVDVLVDSEPASRDFKFRDQIRDSAASAPRNISEGFLRLEPRTR